MSDDDCACGKSVRDVSFAHYLSCGTDAPIAPVEADDLQARALAALERSIGPVAAEVFGLHLQPPIPPAVD